VCEWERFKKLKSESRPAYALMLPPSFPELRRGKKAEMSKNHNTEHSTFKIQTEP